MSKSIGYETSAAIVQTALKQTSGFHSADPNSRIGDLIVETAKREVFRKLIREGVRSAGFGIKWKNIPLDPHVTINHIITAVSTLAGDPGADDD